MSWPSTDFEKAAIEYVDARRAYATAQVDSDDEERRARDAARRRLTAVVAAERPLLDARTRGEQEIRELHRDAVLALSSGALRDRLEEKDPTCALRFLLRSTPLERAAARYVLARIHCAADVDAAAEAFLAHAGDETPLQRAALAYVSGGPASWPDLCNAVAARLDAIDAAGAPRGPADAERSTPSDECAGCAHDDA